MNAIELLKSDHREAEGLMDQIETADKGAASSKALFNELKAALTLHTQIEEQVFYPALRNHEETRDLIEESVREHDEVDQLLAEMTAMSLRDDEFMDKLIELRESVSHHVEEEESEMFAKAEKILGRERLNQMGGEMMQMKQGRSRKATNPR
ncbi:MAG TPA: hemerythrin domain-containing protein [Blastocatellia bacterium]|jgi:hemerythrin superfamily protein